MHCPRCNGVGERMSWVTGQWHVCNTCKGKGYLGPDPDEEQEKEDATSAEAVNGEKEEAEEV